jgi:hypothetical protein
MNKTKLNPWRVEMIFPITNHIAKSRPPSLSWMPLLYDSLTICLLPLLCYNLTIRPQDPLLLCKQRTIPACKDLCSSRVLNSLYFRQYLIFETRQNTCHFY